MATKQKIVSISLDPTKHKELKKKAIDMDISLSELLVNGGTQSYETWLKNQKKI